MPLNIIFMGKGLDDHQMKMVQAIIRAEKMPDLKEHLRSIGVGGMTVYSVSGWSKKERTSSSVEGSTCII